METKTTITIARQMGSGGSYLGQMIATRLGIKYVDREVLHLAAQEFGLAEEELAAREERCLSFWQKMFGIFTLTAPDAHYSPPPLRPISDKQLFDKETEIMKQIAERDDCVIIGRAGAYVLRRHPGMVNLFCHAPLRFRVRRVMQLYQYPSEEQARAVVEESDRMRKRYFAENASRDWACADNYHLSIDTSLLPLPELAELVLEFIQRRLALRQA